MSQFVLHPGAVQDLNEIWEYVASDSLDAADQFVEESFPPNKRKRLPTFLRKLDLCVASGHRCLDGFDDAPDMWPKSWPLLLSENYHRDFTAREVLLIRHILVSS